MSGPDTFTTVLPVPPSTNGLWRSVPGKGVLKSREYRKWLQEAEAVLLEDAWKGARYRNDPVRVRIVPPYNGRRDLDNYPKAILDALVQAKVLANDNMVHVEGIEVEAGAKGQFGCIVTISRIAPERASIGET